MDDVLKLVTQCSPKDARKRTVNKTSWKQKQLLEKRYKSPGLPSQPQCGHNSKSFKCTTITPQQVRKFHQSFYKCKGKLAQDSFLLRYCNIKKPRNPKGKRNFTIKYTIRGDKDKKVPVCQKTFLKVLLLKKHRVQGVMSRFHSSGGEMPVENRGGDRRSTKFEEKKKEVKKFIESFKGQESHYCRSKNIERIYLNPELNIRKMWRLYNDSRPENEKVKQHYFRKIFNTCYNIGFQKPRTDVCSTCISLNERIKIEKDAEKKNKLIIEKRVHRLKYKAFYNIMKENDEALLTITFDCQKNQALPKVPDQSAYFSKQINFYNFVIVKGNSKATLSKENVHSYFWNETSHSKGSNEIISAVYHFLRNLVIEEKTKILRIISDGCSGQNKNTGMISMLGKWLVLEAPKHIKKVEFIFPIVGHSFIPPDRVFAKLEKEIKTKEVIVSPTDYETILKKHCTCFDLTNIEVYDWKSAYEPVVKPTTSWHFPFQKSKRFFLTRTKTGNTLVQGEITYRNENGIKKTITKRGKSVSDIRPNIIQPNRLVPKLSKMKDIRNLLCKHFGNNWIELEELAFYKEIEQRLQPQNENIFQTQDDVNEDGLCERGFEQVNLVI